MSEAQTGLLTDRGPVQREAGLDQPAQQNPGLADLPAKCSRTSEPTESARPGLSARRIRRISPRFPVPVSHHILTCFVTRRETPEATGLN